MGDASRRVLLAACVGLTIRPDAADAGYIVTTVAGNGSSACTGDGGPATGAKLGRIRGIVIDQLGRLIMSDTECTAYRRVDAAGIITTVAGNGQCGFADGPLLSAKLEPGASKIG